MKGGFLGKLTIIIVNVFEEIYEKTLHVGFKHRIVVLTNTFL